MSSKNYMVFLWLGFILVLCLVVYVIYERRRRHSHHHSHHHSVPDTPIDPQSPEAPSPVDIDDLNKFALRNRNINFDGEYWQNRYYYRNPLSPDIYDVDIQGYGMSGNGRCQNNIGNYNSFATQEVNDFFQSAPHPKRCRGRKFNRMGAI